MKLQNMKLSKEEAQEMMPKTAEAPDAPTYPYGLRLDLNDEVLKKLKLGSLPEIGAKLNLQAVVEVCAMSASDSKEGGKYRSLCLQITDMGLEKDRKNVSEVLYGESA